MEGEQITYFAATDYRNNRVPFGIKAEDRTKHVYVIGKTGMGKSTCLENMAVQDIQNGNGMAFLDPHGKTAELLLEYVPEERIQDVLYFAPFDMEFPIAFNVMEDVGADKRHLVASGMMSAFKKIWVDMWSARMEYILNNILLSLLEYPDATLMSVNRMLADKDYRNEVVKYITDPSVKAFWTDEFAKYGDRYMQEAGASIQNKIGQFISNPIIRNIIGQPKSTFDIREMMDNKKIIIINLSKGQVGEANANLLGSMLITKIYLAAMSRADVGVGIDKLPNFYLFVDEFQSFANESFADILSEARKYKLNLTIAHQYIEQMSDEVRAAVFGNVGTMISFRIGAYDAETLEKEFAPKFTAEDMVNLGFTQIYLKLMINGISSQPFSARTLPPIEKNENSFINEIIEYNRTNFARPRAVIEAEIVEWQEPVKKPQPPRTASTGSSSSGSQGGGQRSSSPSGNKSSGSYASASRSGGSSQGTRRAPTQSTYTKAPSSSPSPMSSPAPARRDEGGGPLRQNSNRSQSSSGSSLQSAIRTARIDEPRPQREDREKKQKAMNDLKEALSKATGAAAPKPAAPQPKKDDGFVKIKDFKAPKKVVDAPQQPKARQSTPKEIPEEVLRDVLK